jgi:hypothetical protein
MPKLSVRSRLSESWYMRSKKSRLRLERRKKCYQPSH